MKKLKYYLLIAAIAVASFIGIRTFKNKTAQVTTGNTPTEDVTKTTSSQNTDIRINKVNDTDRIFNSGFYDGPEYYNEINLYTQYYSRNEILEYYGLDMLDDKLDSIVNEIFNELSYVNENIVYFINPDSTEKIYGVYKKDNFKFDRNSIKYCDSNSDKELIILIEKDTNITRPGLGYASDEENNNYEASIINGHKVILKKYDSSHYMCDIEINDLKISIETYGFSEDLLLEFTEKFFCDKY